ncbi:MAG: hypothetical protein ACOC7R_03250 [Planctomycetota bacterium]
MTRRSALLTGLLTASVASLAGCPRCDVELVGREVLFDAHNTNAEKIPALWAIADVEINFARAGLFRSYRLPDGRLYFRRRGDDPLGPHYVMLRGKEIDREVFRLGIDADAGLFYYWVNIPGGESLARWGPLAALHTVDGEGIPMDPSQLLNALGVVAWPTDPDAPSQVVLRTPEQRCVYAMLTVARRDAWGGWYLARETLIDRRDENRRPYQTMLYDRQGRIAMTADLEAYEPVATPDDPSTRPEVPTDIRLTWPESEPIRSIRLRLSGMTTGSDEAPVPPPRAFQLRVPPAIRDARPLGEPAPPVIQETAP